MGTPKIPKHPLIYTFDELSKREQQVAKLYSEGLGCKAIARRLNRSVKTISTYHTRILEKLDVKNDVQLGIYLATVFPCSK